MKISTRLASAAITRRESAVVGSGAMGDNRRIAFSTLDSIGDMEAAKSSFSALLTRLAYIVALSAILLAATFELWPQISFWQQERLAKHLVAELEQSGNPQILTVLKQVSSLGKPSIEPLVLAAASERADIALTARRIIEEELAAWQMQAEQATQASLAEPIAVLADALAEHIDKFGAFGQQWATRLALDIVDLAGDFDVEEAVPVLADCSAVLSAAPALGPRMLTPIEPMTPKDSTSFAAALPEVKLPPLAPEEVVKRSRGTSVTHDAEPAISSEAVENPRTTQELLQSTAIPRNSSWVPEWVGQTKPPVIEEAEPIAKAEPTAPAATSGELIEVPSPEEQAKMIESLEPQGTRELLAQLKAADKFEAAAIREALVARGIAVEELALADKLFAADAAERLALVDDLKVLPARTARRWLRELLVDQEAEVRLRALSALATTNDPELPSIARDMAVRDSDRRVAELALRVIREMR